MRDFRTAIYAACGFLNDVQRIGGAACIRRQRKSPGVLAVITHLSAPKLAEPPNDQKHVGIRIEEREPLADDKISYGGMNSLEADGKFDFKESNKVGFQSFGAQFCEVKIDPELPLVLVTRWVSVRIAGALINLKTGRSQILGGIVMGIEMALEEETALR